MSGRFERLEDGLKKINANFSPVARWLGLIGLAIGIGTQNPAIAYACVGLLALPSVVGKP